METYLFLRLQNNGSDVMSIMDKKTRGRVNELISAQADNTSVRAKAIDSSQSKLVLKRKGLLDITPTVSNKRVLCVGIWPSNSSYFLTHDLISRGIPFHTATWSAFVANYNTPAWLSAYDVVITAGTYLADDTATPTTVKPVIQDIINNGKYKFVQIGEFGMSKIGETTVYWFDDPMGLHTQSVGGNLYTTDAGSTPVTILQDPLTPVLAEDIVYTITGYRTSLVGSAGLVKLAYITSPTAITYCASNLSKNFVIITLEAGYNKMVDVGLVVKYFRGNIKSTIAFNRYKGKKYLAWGWDCDRTNMLDATNNIIEVSGTRPIELSLVTSKLIDQTIIKNYQDLQANGVKIVSHTATHYSNTIPYYLEYIKSIEDLDNLGFINDGIHYQTGDVLADKSLDTAIANGLFNVRIYAGSNGQERSIYSFRNCNRNDDGIIKTRRLSCSWCDRYRRYLEFWVKW